MNLKKLTGDKRVGGEKMKEREKELKEIAEEMLNVAISKKISCSQMELVMFYLDTKVKQRAGEKIF